MCVGVCTGLDEPPAGDVAGVAVRQHLVRIGQVDQVHGGTAGRRSGQLQQGDIVSNTGAKSKTQQNSNFPSIFKF